MRKIIEQTTKINHKKLPKAFDNFCRTFGRRRCFSSSTVTLCLLSACCADSVKVKKYILQQMEENCLYQFCRLVKRFGKIEVDSVDYFSFFKEYAGKPANLTHIYNFSGALFNWNTCNTHPMMLKMIQGSSRKQSHVWHLWSPPQSSPMLRCCERQGPDLPGPTKCTTPLWSPVWAHRAVNSNIIS